MAAGGYIAWRPWDRGILEMGTVLVPEAASLNVKRGTPGLWDSAGRAAAVGTGPALTGFIFAEDTHNTGAEVNSVLVWPLRPDDIWEIVITNAMLRNMFGLVDFGIVKDATSGYWYGDSGDAGAQFRPTDFLTGPAGFNIGDTKWIARGRFAQAKIQTL